MSRIIYCECGKFIPIDTQDLQSSPKKKCILCLVKEGIDLVESMEEPRP